MLATAKSYILLQIRYFSFVLNIWFYFFFFFTMIFVSIFCIIVKRLEIKRLETREVKSYEKPKSVLLSYLCVNVAILLNIKYQQEISLSNEHNDIVLFDSSNKSTDFWIMKVFCDWTFPQQNPNMAYCKD